MMVWHIWWETTMVYIQQRERSDWHIPLQWYGGVAKISQIQIIFFFSSLITSFTNCFFIFHSVSMVLWPSWIWFNYGCPYLFHYLLLLRRKHFAMLGFDSSTNDRNLKNQLFVWSCPGTMLKLRIFVLDKGLVFLVATRSFGEGSIVLVC